MDKQIMVYSVKETTNKTKRQPKKKIKIKKLKNKKN